LNKYVSKVEIVEKIVELNNDESVSGIMLQLPLPEELVLYQKEIVDNIDARKDVDGLRDDSPYVTPVVAAIEQILKYQKITFAMTITLILYLLWDMRFCRGESF